MAALAAELSAFAPSARAAAARVRIALSKSASPASSEPVKSPPRRRLCNRSRSWTAARITVPWTALMAAGATPAVWTIDPHTNKATLKAVTVARYEAETVVIKDGLTPGDRVVIDGGKLLSTGQPVTFAGGAS